MDPITKRRMRSAHAKHVGYCTCGKMVRGNGGRAAHAYMHERRGDGHHYVIEDVWRSMFPEKATR